MSFFIERIRKIRKLSNLLGCKNYRKGLVLGVAAAIEHTNFLRELKNSGCDFIVDAGANIGQFSLACMEELPGVPILAFEPLIGPHGVMTKLIKDQKHVTLKQVGLGEEAGTFAMNVSRKNDSSSLLAISKLQSDIFPGTELDHLENVQISTLDEELNGVTLGDAPLLKIDVQGFELSLLKGSLENLHRFKYVYVEASFLELYSGQPKIFEVIDWLKQRNFYLWRIPNVSWDASGVSVQGDFAFIRDRY